MSKEELIGENLSNQYETEQSIENKFNEFLSKYHGSFRAAAM